MSNKVIVAGDVGTDDLRQGPGHYTGHPASR